MNWSLTITGDESEVRDLAKIAIMLRETTTPEEIEGKYSPLQTFLIQKKEEGETRLELTIEEVQNIIQDELPPNRLLYAGDLRRLGREIVTQRQRPRIAMPQLLRRDKSGDSSDDEAQFGWLPPKAPGED